MNNKEKVFIQQIEEIIDIFMKNKSILIKEYGISQEGGVLANILNTRIMAVITRITGINSEYYKQAMNVLPNISEPIARLIGLYGVLSGLYLDLKAGYLKSFSELIHADIFSDYIEMAEYLLEEGYKDPAAVITGSTLEEHLRKLCIKNGINIEIMSSRKLRLKKADTINSELAKQGVYNKLEQKSVTAWLDLRNKAAHGKYSEYKENQVKQLIKGVRDFIVRNPA